MDISSPQPKLEGNMKRPRYPMSLKGLQEQNNEGRGVCIKGFPANTSKDPDEAESTSAMHPTPCNSGFTLPFRGV